MVKKETTEDKPKAAKKAVSKVKVEKATTKKPESTTKTTKAKENNDGITQKSSGPKVQTTEGEKEVVSETSLENSSEDKTQESGEKTATAKAGKRSEKALKEADAKEAKEERKAQARQSEKDSEDRPKQLKKPVRSKLERKGKNYRKVATHIETGKSYSLKEALDLAVKTNPVKFDATIEMHIRLGVDPRQADQNLRDTFVLPAGTGKSVRVAVLADPNDVTAAKKAGADIAGSEEFLQQLDKGTIDFDVLIATPAMMPKLGKYARVLGPKGLMPNPKSGTVTNDVAKAVAEAKAGRVEYRVDSTGIVHLGMGKASFGGAKLLENGRAVLASIKSNRPASIKVTYVRSIFVTSSMGPSVAVDTNEAN